jgi:hypothetical protein
MLSSTSSSVIWGPSICSVVLSIIGVLGLNTAPKAIVTVATLVNQGDELGAVITVTTQNSGGSHSDALHVCSISTRVLVRR